MNTFAQKMMNTINGKLIVLKSSELDEIKQIVEQIDLKFDRMEMQKAIAPEISMNESLELQESFGLSMQKFRKIYSRWVWVILATSLGLNVTNLVVSRHPFCAVESSANATDRDGNVRSIGETR